MAIGDGVGRDLIGVGEGGGASGVGVVVNGHEWIMENCATVRNSEKSENTE